MHFLNAHINSTGYLNTTNLKIFDLKIKIRIKFGRRNILMDRFKYFAVKMTKIYGTLIFLKC